MSDQNGQQSWRDRLFGGTSPDEQKDTASPSRETGADEPAVDDQPLANDSVVADDHAVSDEHAVADEPAAADDQTLLGGEPASDEHFDETPLADAVERDAAAAEPAPAEPAAAGPKPAASVEDEQRAWQAEFDGEDKEPTAEYRPSPSTPAPDAEVEPQVVPPSTLRGANPTGELNAVDSHELVEPARPQLSLRRRERAIADAREAEAALADDDSASASSAPAAGAAGAGAAAAGTAAAGTAAAGSAGDPAVDHDARTPRTHDDQQTRVLETQDHRPAEDGHAADARTADGRAADGHAADGHAADDRNGSVGPAVAAGAAGVGVAGAGAAAASHGSSSHHAEATHAGGTAAHGTATPTAADDTRTRTVDAPPARERDVDDIMLVEQPAEPRKRGARGVGFVVVLLSTIVFGGLLGLALVGVQYLFDTEFDAGSLLTVWLSPLWIFPVVVFFLAYWILTLVVNRAGWWAHVLGGFIVALLAYGAYIFAANFEHNGGWESLGNLFTFTREGIVPSIVAPAAVVTFVLAREVPIWLGGIVSKRGRKQRERYNTEIEEYRRQTERENEAV
ncbi:hypothetical protein [Agrococcus casei]|uniref:Uncharacterized protein n=2 Tax=Agrococcus TaxID=46352 RepID=A0A1R4F9P8_9MICO|nr:hypothetical protein [Agrococcus casei]SJM52563.1 hypothetical protein CZ674_03270 [Agrococcus casei LMG 22410]